MASGPEMAGGGECSYNGVDFGPFLKSRVRGQMVYDDARRRVKHVQYTLECSSFINTPGESSDDTMQGLRRALAEPCKQLIYEDKGFGSLRVNDGETWDVAGGPRPELLSWTPVGANQTAHIEWRVVVNVPECIDARTRGRLMMANYEVDRSLDVHGYHVITTTGAIEIPMTFPDDRLPDHIDNYLDRIEPPVPLGFQRERRYHESNDRRRLQFTYTDRELPIPLPAGVTMADARHSLQSNIRAYAFHHWFSTVQGSVRMNPAFPKSDAWDRFFKIVFSRIEATRQQRSQRNIGGRGVVRLTDIEFDEEIFGMSSRFRVRYEIIGCRLSAILDVSGIWRPIPDNTWEAWNQSLADNAHHPRGNLRVHSASTDTIIDLCTPTPPNRSNPYTTDPPDESNPYTPDDPDAGGINAGGGGGGSPVVAPNPAVLGGGGNPYTAGGGINGGGSNPYSPGGRDGRPAPEESWLGYQSFLLYLEDDHVVRHKPMGGTVTINPPEADPMNVRELARQVDPAGPGFRASKPDRLQRLTSPSLTIVLRGEATRLGYPAQPPQLLRYAGRDVVQTRRAVEQGEVGEINGIPVYAIFWEIHYLLSRPPDALPLPANPWTTEPPGEEFDQPPDNLPIGFM